MIVEFQQTERASSFDVVYISPVRWEDEQSRFHHIMRCCAQEHRVFFIEEPCFTQGPISLALSHSQERLWIATPSLPNETPLWKANTIQQQMLDHLLADYQIENYLLWYTQPEALAFTDHLEPLGIIYDSIDGLSRWNRETFDLRRSNTSLLTCADLVLLSEQSLHEMNSYHHHTVPLLLQQTEMKPVVPAWMLIKTPPSSENCPTHWEKVWQTMRPILDGIAAERSDWPCYSI